MDVKDCVRETKDLKKPNQLLNHSSNQGKRENFEIVMELVEHPVSKIYAD